MDILLEHYIGLVQKYRSTCNELEGEKAELSEKLQLAWGKIENLERANYVELLSQNNDCNSSCDYQRYPPINSENFIDPANVHPLDDYSIGLSDDEDLVLFTPITPFESEESTCAKRTERSEEWDEKAELKRQKIT